MTRRIDLSQWRDKTEEPVIVWAYTGYVELLPVAVDDSHDNDVYQELARAWWAANAYMTFDEVCGWYSNDYTPAQVEDLYRKGDGSADSAGLPYEMYVESVNEDGSDAVIYIDQATEFETHRESLEEATPYLEPEDVAEIYRAMLEARKEYEA